MTRLITQGWEDGSNHGGWSGTAGGSNITGAASFAGAARTGTRVLQQQGGSITDSYTWGSSEAEIWMRVGIYIANAPVAGSGSIIRFVDSNGAIAASVGYNYATNLLSIYRGDFSVLLAAATVPMGTASWSCLEVHYKPLNVAGVFDLYLESVLICHDTSGNTRAGSVNNVVSVQIKTPAVSVTHIWDDLAVNNVSGGDNNGRFADGSGRLGGILGLKPNGDNAVQWTPNSGGTNYTQVDEVPADGDTTYVYDSTVGHRDLYDIEDIPGTVISIATVHVDTTARNTDASGNQISIVTNSGGTITVEAPVSLTQTYTLYRSQTFGVDPHTGVAWLEAGVNALLVGQDVA